MPLRTSGDGIARSLTRDNTRTRRPVPPQRSRRRPGKSAWQAAPTVSCMMKVTVITFAHAPKKLSEDALPDRALARAGRRMVEHADPARRAARLHPLRGI